MPTQKTGDAWQWLSVNEDRILLHDGLILLVDYIAVPSGISDTTTEDAGLPALDGKTPTELAEIIHRECRVKLVTFGSLLEYRFNALKGLWKSIRDIEKKGLVPHSKKELTNNSRASNAGASFSSRISLVLIFPIMKSLSKFDPNLSSEAASVLLETLRACEPLSLNQESQDCINGLESLLQSWLSSAQGQSDIALAQVQVQNAASALVALSVAVGTGTLMMRTVHLLQTLQLKYPVMRLLVPGILGKLLSEHRAREECTVLCAEAHVISWNYDDIPVADGKEALGPKSICTDGQFVYTTSASQKLLLKLGSGKNGTIRAYLYAKMDVEGGWVVWVNERLLHVVCKKKDDKELEPTFVELDPHTLKPCAPPMSFMGAPSESVDTLQIASDGVFLYWVYVIRSSETVAHPVTGEKVKQHLVCVQPLHIQEGSKIVAEGKCVTLQRGVETEKGSDVMRTLVRSNPAAITALLGGSREENVTAVTTTIGHSIKTLQHSTVYVTGSAVVFLVPPTTSASGRNLFSSSVAQSTKASCVSVCFSLTSGKFISQQELIPTTQTQCALTRSTSLQGIAACYDAKCHCVWTLCDNGVDMWDCTGRCRIALHQVAQRMAEGSVEKLIPAVSCGQVDSINVGDAVALMLRHIGIESCQIAPVNGMGTYVTCSLPLVFLEQCCDQLKWSMEEKNWSNAQAIVITLQAVISGFVSGQYPVEKLALLKERVRQLVWSLLMDPSCPSHILQEARRVISNNVEVLFLNDDGIGQFLHTLQSPADAVSVLASLRDEVFVQLAQSLSSRSSLSPHMMSICNLLSGAVLEDSVSAVRRGRDCHTEEFPTLMAQCPVLTPAVQCAAALHNVVLRQLVMAQEEGKEIEAFQRVLAELWDSLQVFKTCQTTFEELCESARIVSSISDEQTRAQRTQLLDRLSKGTIVGSLLLPILVSMSNPSMGTLAMTSSLQRHLGILTQHAAEVCGLLYGGMLESTQVRIPAPWATGRVVETIHPVRDNYKFKETVSFPGARNLYLKFDARCASQYDYDKVTVFAGDTKVAEYGGNTHGYGSRSVLGKGWPKDVVKVEGDAVTIAFEMKSGREQSTPDKAMWGFACTVRPQDSAEDTPSGLPFFLDLYLSLASVCCSLILKQYSGPDVSKDELNCKGLLSSELLQRCVWQENQGLPMDHPVQFKPAPHHPLPATVITQLRALVAKAQPTLRPSTCELLQPEMLEDVILRACLKQYRLDDLVLHVLGPQEHPKADTIKSLLSGVFTRINALERRLQALVELEKAWWNEVQEIVTGSHKPTNAYFFDLLQHESSLKSFELLCCLKSVDLNHSDLFTTAETLQNLLEKDVENVSAAGLSSPLDYTPLTRQMVAGVIAQAGFILSVTLSQDPPLMKMKSVDDAQHQQSPGFSRSVSVPAASELGHRYSRSLLNNSRKSSLLDVSDPSESQSNLLDQIFKFIGSKPEQAVTCDAFLAAANLQRQRGVCRVSALRCLSQLLSGKHIHVAVEHVLACVGAVLQQGPKVTDVACGGMSQPVREAFADVMCAVVQLASKQPAACINTIATLCIIPYTRADEACLVRSGLVKLLDQLCSLMDAHRPMQAEGGEDETLQRVTVLAWAAFQVLAERCVSWEAGNTAAVSSGLAHQVSALLTNHLSRTMEALVLSEAGASEGLQDALSLLLELGRSQMGKAILSQPTCVSKLLLLLTDQRPSPKLVLIALQLCRIALPLMSPAECSKVTLPFHPSVGSSQDNMATGIVSLLLAKLADYIVADASHTQPYQEAGTETSGSDGEGHPARKLDECDENGQASVYIYKRENENAAEILQPLMGLDPRHGRSGHRAQEGLAAKMDRELSEHGRAEILTDTYRVCVRRALRLSSLGLVVSVGAPSGGVEEVPGGVVDKRRAQSEAAAKKKNLQLIKSDPPRPFVSGHVAYSLAGEVIGLLHNLLTEPRAAEVWGSAIKKVLTDALELAPHLLPQLVAYTEHVHACAGTGAAVSPPDPSLQAAYIINATFAALGGFKEGIRPGMAVQLIGDGVHQTGAVVQSISEQRGMANIHFPSDDLCFGPGRTLEVPIARLLPPQKETLPLEHLGIRSQLFNAICSLLATPPPSITLVHSSVDATFPGLGTCRLFAELRSRAAMALAHHVQLPVFAELAKDPECVSKMMALAKQCSPGLRLDEVESRCQSLRMMYRDCSRPPPPKVEKPQAQPKRIELDTRRQWPPVTSCCFTHNLTSVTYQGPTVVGGQEALAPRGVLLFATTSIPPQASAFYWELELCLLAESSDAVSVAMGYSPIPPQQQGEGQQSWQYPHDTCLMRSSGRACQVRGDSQLDWGTFRTDSPLKSGDVLGCGWVKQEGGASGQVYFTVNGHRLEQEFLAVPAEMFPFVHIQKKATRVRVNFGDRPFFYGEGHAHRNAAELGVEKTEEVAAHFEALPFAVYGSDSEGDGSEDEDEGGAGGEECRANECPPPSVGDENNGTNQVGGAGSSGEVGGAGSVGTIGSVRSEGETSDKEKDPVLAAEGGKDPVPAAEGGKDPVLAAEGGKDPVLAAEGSVLDLAHSCPAVRVLKVPAALHAYNSEAFQGYQLTKSFDNMLEGSRVRAGGSVEEDEEEEEGVEVGGSDSDLHALLVKAWEAKVFPVIQRRFRNDQERKSGLEQIKGALQLGMETIARETVEFLYEENGGMPKDLQLPTMDSVKVEQGKFTIDKVKKGSAVVVQKEIPCNRFGVRTMLKTQGLTGIVLAVDEPNELVQVECYLQSEGALVRFWYPVLCLERPPPGYRRSESLRAIDATNMIVHRQLLCCESSLVNMYSRKALLTICQSCTSTQLDLMQEARMVANECFAGSHVDGTCTTISLLLNSAPTGRSYTLAPSPFNLFFSAPQRLHDVISRAMCRGQLEATATLMLGRMLNASNGFGACILKMTEDKEAADVTCPESAFMIVSCLDDKTQPQASSTSSKAPWARVFCYRGGQGKGGKQQLQEVVRYPNEVQQNQHYCGPLYPSVLVPFNLVHVKWGGCTSPGKVLAITAIPEDLPLSLSFIHTLTHSSSFEDKLEYCRALTMCSDALISLLSHHDCPVLLKETLFHQLAEVMWSLLAISPEDYTMPAATVSFTEFFHKIQEEVLLLYEAECSAFVTDKGKPPGQFPPPGSMAQGEVGKFSTYFQALLELVLATQQCIQKGLHGSPSPSKKRKSRRGSKKDGESDSRKMTGWLNTVASAAGLLQALTSGQEQSSCFLDSSLPCHPCRRLLVLTNLNPKLSHEALKLKLCKVCRAHGGLYKNMVHFLKVAKTSEGPSEGSQDHSPIHAVLELCCSAKGPAVIAALSASPDLKSDGGSLGVCAVRDGLKSGEEEEATKVLAQYLFSKLVQDGGLVPEALQVLTTIFNSCVPILKTDVHNSLELFLTGCSGGHKDALVENLWSTFGNNSGLKVDGLLSWAVQRASSDAISVWNGLFAAGFDLHFQRCGFPANSAPSRQLTRSQHVALVNYVDSICRHLAVTSGQLCAWDIAPLEPSVMVNEHLEPLQGLSLEDLRLGFLQLSHINSELSKLLMAVDLRYTHPLSLGSQLSQLSALMFYDVKMSFVHAVLNASTRRSWDQAPPEIKMDPLQSAISIASSPLGTQFCQAAQGMANVPSSQLCVPLASGGDPTYAFNVKLTGEDVHGTSGSFRHFLWQVVRELQSPVLPILIPCPSGAAGVNKGKYILMPGPHTYSEEKLLQFFGQLLGVAVRADLPIALDFLPCFWKSLCGYQLDLEDLKDADCLTYKLTRKFLECNSPEEFEQLAATFPHSHSDDSETTTSCGLQFVYTSIDGRDVELCPGGRDMLVTFDNCKRFAEAVEEYRLRELSNRTRMDAIRQGLASVVPLQLLRILTVRDLDLRVCGLPDVNLDYLKSHTMYQVGLMETDQHVLYFWNALESFTQDELRKFIKFACNQERIPFGHPCREDAAKHVPPFPMKIAPPDGKGPPDSRYIRAETCLFMIKLPQYSSQEIMTQKLHYAIYCREDPLSG